MHIEQSHETQRLNDLLAAIAAAEVQRRQILAGWAQNRAEAKRRQQQQTAAVMGRIWETTEGQDNG